MPRAVDPRLFSSPAGADTTQTHERIVDPEKHTPLLLKKRVATRDFLITTDVSPSTVLPRLRLYCRYTAGECEGVFGAFDDLASSAAARCAAIREWARESSQRLTSVKMLLRGKVAVVVSERLLRGVDGTPEYIYGSCDVCVQLCDLEVLAVIRLLRSFKVLVTPRPVKTNKQND